MSFTQSRCKDLSISAYKSKEFELPHYMLIFQLFGFLAGELLHPEHVWRYSL